MKTFLFCLLSVAVFCLAISAGAINDPFRLSAAVFLYAMTRFFAEKKPHKVIVYVPFALFTIYFFYSKFILGEDFRFFENLPYIILVPIFLFYPINMKEKKWRNLAFIVLFSTFLYPFWFNYMTLIRSDRTKKAFPSEIRLQNLDGTGFDRAGFGNKTVVLNFFSERCGLCFDEMPYYEELKNRNRSKEHLEVVTVFLSKKAELNEREEKVLREVSSNYSFKLLRSEKTADEVFEALGFRGVPHCVVLKDNVIVYSGGFNHEWYYLVHNINRLVKL